MTTLTNISSDTGCVCHTCALLCILGGSNELLQLQIISYDLLLVAPLCYFPLHFFRMKNEKSFFKHSGRAKW